jgi:hypothetical protein
MENKRKRKGKRKITELSKNLALEQFLANYCGGPIQMSL